MKRLRDRDQDILKLISEAMPIGINPTKLLLSMNITPQNLNGHLKKLYKKGLITKKKEGIITLYYLVGTTNTVYSTSQAKQRPHSIQVAALLFRTSWGRLEATLASLSMPYNKELKDNLIRFNYGNKEFRATSKWLYCFVELPQMPLNVPIEEVKARAMLEAGNRIEALLNKTGLRCIRDRLGMLALEVRYWENGYPGNEIAEESLKDKSRVVYAYDSSTGKVRAWADSSLGDLKELETNSERVDAEMKAFIQSIENRELRPYQDEINTRRNIEGLITINQKLTENLDKYAKNIDTHMAFMYDALKRFDEHLGYSRADGSTEGPNPITTYHKGNVHSEDQPSVNLRRLKGQSNISDFI